MILRNFTEDKLIQDELQWYKCDAHIQTHECCQSYAMQDWLGKNSVKRTTTNFFPFDVYILVWETGGWSRVSKIAHLQLNKWKQKRRPGPTWMTLNGKWTRLIVQDYVHYYILRFFHRKNTLDWIVVAVDVEVHRLFIGSPASHRSLEPAGKLWRLLFPWMRPSWRAGHEGTWRVTSVKSVLEALRDAHADFRERTFIWDHPLVASIWSWRWSGDA